jgi:uncharacterized protein (DUF362 family)
MTSKVSLVVGDSRKRNVYNALELIKDEIKAQGNVFIKPNLSAARNAYANTSTDAVEGVIDFLNDHFRGLSITVGEGSGSAYLAGMRTRTLLERFGYYGLEKKYGNVRVADLDEWKDFQTMSVEMVHGHSSVRIMKHDFDYVMSLSLPKTHDFVIATLGIKNMMATVHRHDRIHIHGLRGKAFLQGGTKMFPFLPEAIWKPFHDLGRYFVVTFGGYSKSVVLTNRNLAQLAKTTKLDLVVLDAMTGMEGEGPLLGTTVRLGVAVASIDPLKADGVGVRLMGLDPGDIGYLWYLQRDGYGDYSLEGLVGERIEPHSKRFKMHSRYAEQKEWRASKKNI